MLPYIDNTPSLLFKRNNYAKTAGKIIDLKILLYHF